MKQQVNSIDYLMSCVDKWMKANEKEGKVVEFFGAFWIINPEKDFNVKDDRMIAFGLKDNLIMSIEEMAKDMIDEKEEFISW